MLQKKELFLEYPFVRAFLKGDVDKKTFLKDLEAFKPELLSKGATEGDINVFSKLAILHREAQNNTENSQGLEVYHATYTGPNLEILNSFIEKGADPKIAQGHGQGAGFYVWTSKELAENHAINFLGENPKLGNLMIIKMVVKPNPDLWDLDYELNGKIISTFIYENFELVKKIPDSVINVDGNRLCPSILKKNEKYKTFQIVLFDEKNNKRVKSFGSERGEWSVGEAAIIGAIFNYLQVHNPEKTQEVEWKIFRQTGIKTAIKYVGKENLPLKGVEVYIDRQWVNGLEMLRKQTT